MRSVERCSDPQIRLKRCDTVSRSSGDVPYAPDARTGVTDRISTHGEKSHMRSSRTVLAAAIVFGAALSLHALTPQAPAAAPQNPPAGPPTAAPSAGDPPRAVPPGRGGGRGNPAAALYTETCSGCHGTGLEGGRVPSLFDDKWTHATDDESMAAIIANGIPNTEMVPFKATLNEPQIWQLVAYLRTQGANLKEKPQLVPDPDGQVIKSEKQTFKIEVVARNLETPWGLAFLPDGRLLVTERPGRLRIVEKGTLLPEPVKGTPKVWEKQDGGLLDVEVHPRVRDATAGSTWPIPRRCLATRRRAAAPVDAAPPPAPAPAPQVGRGRGGPPDPPSMTVIVRGKINKNNEWTDQQVIFRAPPELYSSTNAHYGSRFIFDKQGHLFFTHRREERHGARAGPGRSARQDPPRQRRRDRARRTTRSSTAPDAIPTIWSYGHRNPQGLAWDPGRRQAVGVGTRPAGRRRDQHHRARAQLRLGRDHAWAFSPASPSARKKGWSSRSSTTRRRSRRAASRSTPARSIRAGRTTCS